MVRTYREIAEELVQARIRHNLPGIRDVEEQLDNLERRKGEERWNMTKQGIDGIPGLFRAGKITSAEYGDYLRFLILQHDRVFIPRRIGNRQQTKKELLASVRRTEDLLQEAREHD